MTDCSNLEMREWLPELVNGRLAAALLVEVRTHVESCVACQGEVQILERARGVFLFTTPRIDTARIVALLPGAPVARGISFDWRIAASILVLAVGGGSAALMYGHRASPQVTDTIAFGAPTTEASSSELSIAGDLSGLSDDQLRTLVGRVESIESLPAAEVGPSTEMTGIVPAAASSTSNHDSSGTM
jgi:hypothetical protein